MLSGGLNKLFTPLKKSLLDAGACRVGFADLMLFPDKEVQTVFRTRLKIGEKTRLRGVSIAVTLPPQVVAGLKDGPTRSYHDAYCAANETLDRLARQCTYWLENAGFATWPQMQENIASHDTLNAHATRLPHKTVATLAGMGWIGKNALLVSPRFGSAIRITSVVTVAPLPCDIPVSTPHCGSCDKCIQSCPATAIHGATWQMGETMTDDLVDVKRCEHVAQRLCRKNFGINNRICGFCLYICPFTQKWLRRQQLPL